MKQIFLFALSIVILSLAFAACDDQKTAQEYLKEEKKAIDKYIDRQNIDVIYSYPEDGVFDLEKNQYFKTPVEGLYFQVVDSGNGKRVVPAVDKVQVRFDYFFDIKDFVGGNENLIYYQWIFPFEFVYGIPGSYQKSENDVFLACDGWAIPLNYVGEGAIVNLIIPSGIGNTSDQNSYRAVFYKNLHYTKFD